jgi:long-chain acyl-CoA synthetase
VTALHELAGVAPDAIAVDDGDQQVSWIDLDLRSTMIGNGVESLGATPGSHVAICVSNRAEFVEASIGAWRAGCSYTPLKTGWTPDEIGGVLDNAETRVVITDRDSPRVAARDRGLAVIDLDDGYERWLGAQSISPLTGDRFGFKMSYTSGTTGRPKGVRLPGSGTTPFDQAWAGLAYWAEVQQLPREGTHLFLSRLFNGAPNTFGFGAMARGATMRILRSWDPAAALAALSAPDVTSTIMVPTMFRQLLALPDVDRSVRPAPAIRTILHGGEPCPIPLKEAIADWFGEVLLEYYGFSEGGFTIVLPDEWRDRPGTVGRPIGGMAVKILDDDGDEVPAKTAGLSATRTTRPRPSLPIAATPTPLVTSAGSTTRDSSICAVGRPTSWCPQASTSTRPRSSRRFPTYLESPTCVQSVGRTSDAARSSSCT